MAINAPCVLLIFHEGEALGETSLTRALSRKFVIGFLTRVNTSGLTFRTNCPS